MQGPRNKSCAPHRTRCRNISPLTSGVGVLSESKCTDRSTNYHIYRVGRRIANPDAETPKSKLAHCGCNSRPGEESYTDLLAIGSVAACFSKRKLGFLVWVWGYEELSRNTGIESSSRRPASALPGAPQRPSYLRLLLMFEVATRSRTNINPAKALKLALKPCAEAKPLHPKRSLSP